MLILFSTFFSRPLRKPGWVLIPVITLCCSSSISKTRARLVCGYARHAHDLLVDTQDVRECNHSHLRACLVTLPSREGWAHKWYSLLGRSWNHASRTRTEIKTNISISFIPFSKQVSLFNSIFLASSKALLSSHCVIFALCFSEKK